MKRKNCYKMGGPKNPPKQVTDPNDPSLKAYQDSLALYNTGQAGLRLYKKGIQNLDELLELERNHAYADSLMKASGIQPTAEMPQRYYELPKSEYGDYRLPKNTRAVGYSQYIFREPEQPVELKKEMGGYMPKYRKYGGAFKKLKFGDFLSDYGKTMLNIGVSPIETVAGRNFYDPEFKNKGFEGVSDVGAGMMGLATDAIGSYYGGQTYMMGKQAAQQTINAVDPNQNLDNTRLDHIDENTYKAYRGLNSLSNVVTSSVGSSKIGVMKNGGMLTKYETGGKHEENPLGGIPMGNNALVEEGETQYNNKNYIFSDSLFIDKDLENEFGLKGANKLSFSKYSKKLDKKFNRENDVFDQTSKQRMLDRLTDAQESYKLNNFVQNYESKLAMKMGGSLYKKYKEGGPTKMYTELEYGTLFPGASTEEYLAYKEEFLNNQLRESSDIPNMQTKSGDYIPSDGSLAPINAGLGDNYSTNPAIPTYDSQGDPKVQNFNINPIYESMRFAPIAANLISSFKSTRLNPKDYMVDKRITAPKLNIDPLLAENRSGYSSALSALKGNAGGNAGAYLANLSSLNAGKYKADAAVYNNKFNQDSQNQFRADQINASLDQFNAESRFRTDDWNIQSSEAAKNLQRKAAEQLGMYGDVKSNEAYQEAYIDAVSENYDFNFDHYVPNTKKYKQKYGYRK